MILIFTIISVYNLELLNYNFHIFREQFKIIFLIKYINGTGSGY